MPAEPARDRLTPQELAQRWHLSPKTLENWRGLGTGPEYLRLGRRVVYRIEDVEAYEAAHSSSGERARKETTP